MCEGALLDPPNKAVTSHSRHNPILPFTITSTIALSSAPPPSPQDGRNLAHTAVKHNNIKALKILIKAGADVTLEDDVREMRMGVSVWLCMFLFGYSGV